jgi:hypothetical protein
MTDRTILAVPFAGAGAIDSPGSSACAPLEHFQAKWIRFAVENAAKSNES